MTATYCRPHNDGSDVMPTDLHDVGRRAFGRDDNDATTMTVAMLTMTMSTMTTMMKMLVPPSPRSEWEPEPPDDRARIG